MNGMMGIAAQPPKNISEFKTCMLCANGPAPSGRGCLPLSCSCKGMMLYDTAVCRRCSNAKHLCEVCGQNLDTISLKAYIEEQAKDQADGDFDGWLEGYADAVTSSPLSPSSLSRYANMAKNTPLIAKEIETIRAAMGSEYGERIKDIAIGQLIADVKKSLKQKKSAAK